jgi:bacterioferritin (cytochrome b1)
MQLQTQVKVNEFVVAEKDQIIASLNQKFLENKVAEDWKVKYEAAETNYAASQNKLKHMDTLLAQIGDMKKTIMLKDEQILLKDEQIAELTAPKKVINRKKKEELLPLTELTEQTTQEKTLDDF